MKTLFIDGSYGTAGLFLLEQLKILKQSIDFHIVFLNKEDYKNEFLRYEQIQKADIAILCLPEEIALKTMQDLKKIDTVVIDISPAHRLNTQWTYGFPELNDQQVKKIKKSNRIANPGCFATGMITLLNPLVDYLNTNPISITGVTGYSAGGKKAIEKQEQNNIAFRMTNLNKIHRHMPEVKHITQLKNNLAFNPSVANFLSGQLVQINLFKNNLQEISLEQVKYKLTQYYKNSEVIKVMNNTPSYLNPESMANTNNMEIYTYINEDYITLVAIYDNLGKGATGAVIQNLKILLQNN